MGIIFSARAEMIQLACGKKLYSSSNEGVIQLREPTTTGGPSR
jgi:hypothetical protein